MNLTKQQKKAAKVSTLRRRRDRDRAALERDTALFERASKAHARGRREAEGERVALPGEFMQHCLSQVSRQWAKECALKVVSQTPELIHDLVFSIYDEVAKEYLHLSRFGMDGYVRYRIFRDLYRDEYRLDLCIPEVRFSSAVSGLDLRIMADPLTMPNTGYTRG